MVVIYFLILIIKLSYQSSRENINSNINLDLIQTKSKKYFKILIILLLIILVENIDRMLTSSITDGSKSTLSCSGTSIFDSYIPVVFTVQAKDIIGNNISSGGDKFVIQIKNE